MKPYPRECEVQGCNSADVALAVTAYEWRCHKHSGGCAGVHPENTAVGRLLAEVDALRARVAELEAALADERKHADYLDNALLQLGDALHCSNTFECDEDHSEKYCFVGMQEAARKAHAARRAKEAADGK